MDRAQSDHLSRVRHLREAFAEANERLVARLRGASDEAASSVASSAAAGAWSAAQIGWHVAHVTTRFAGMMAGDIPGPKPLEDGFQERPWEVIAAAIPARAVASPAVSPPAQVLRDEAVAALEASAMLMAHAFDVLTPERGRMGITHPLVGTITVYQLGDWATAHIKRHNRQAKQALGQG
jgi:hypothetical protein